MQKMWSHEKKNNKKKIRNICLAYLEFAIETLLLFKL